MSKGKAIFQAVCDASDAEAAVAALPLKDWRRLYAYLLADITMEGIRGLIAGIVFVDGARRLNAGGKQL